MNTALEVFDVIKNNSAISIGIICSLIYILRHRKKSKLPQTITMFLCGSALSSGKDLIYLSFEEYCFEDQVSKVYLFIGGLAIIWTCIQTILNILKKDRSRPIFST